MMGCQEAPAQLFYDFCLDDHGPADHMLRGIDRHLELDSVRAHLKPFYSATGRPSIDPELMMLSVPEQYSPIVPFESSPGAAAAGLPWRASGDQRRYIVNTLSDGRKGDIGDQAEGDDHDPGSA